MPSALRFRSPVLALRSQVVITLLLSLDMLRRATLVSLSILMLIRALLTHALALRFGPVEAGQLQS